MVDNHPPWAVSYDTSLQLQVRSNQVMDPVTLRVHLAVIEDVQQKRQKLRDEIQSLDAVESYHMRFIDQHNREVEEARADRPAVSRPGSPLTGKTMADAAEVALAEIGRSCQAKEVAEFLEVAYGYGEGSSNRSYVNALYNAMARTPDIFQNADGIWGLRRVPHSRRITR